MTALISFHNACHFLFQADLLGFLLYVKAQSFNQLHRSEGIRAGHNLAQQLAFLLLNLLAKANPQDIDLAPFFTRKPALELNSRLLGGL